MDDKHNLRKKRYRGSPSKNVQTACETNITLKVLQRGESFKDYRYLLDLFLPYTVVLSV